MKHKEKIKPYKSLFSNVMWSFSKQLEYAPSVLFMYAAQTPFNIWLNYAAIYLPSLVVAQITENKTFYSAATTIGFFMLAVLLSGILQKLLQYLILGKQGFYRYQVTKQLNKKSLSCFYQQYEKKSMRDLYKRASKATDMWDGVQPIQDFPKQVWNLIESVICYILFGTVISFVSPWLILLLTLAPAVNWFCIRAYQNWNYRNRSKCTDIDSKLDYISEKPGDYALAKDIRIYSMATWLTELYKDLTKERSNIDEEQTWRYFLSRIANIIIILLRDGVAYAVLITMMLKGNITIDRFVLYFAAISSFADWVGKILNTLSEMNNSSLAICDLREYVEYPEQEVNGEKDTANLSSVPEIRFEHVSFRYERAEKDTINDISFTIHPGEKIAIVGLNGAGKTTLVKLLCGLYLPANGDIEIDGYSIRSFQHKEYYSLFSPVFQDVRTACFSLAETVSCKTEEETDFTLAESCMRLAGLGDKIDSLPNGIHTKLDKQVNKDGTELSGGQIQKLMLARALYKNAPILILDEPTSALDPIAENEIYLKYNEMSEHKSSLFISHHLSSTRFCDRILYLENGRIIEEGSHEDLIKLGGKYSKLYEMQSCWYRDGKEKITNEAV